MQMKHGVFRGAFARVLAVVLLISAPSIARAGVLVVDPGAPGAFTNVQAAVDAAADGDVILLRSNVLGSFELVGKSLTLLGDTGFFPYCQGFDSHNIVRDVGPAGVVVLRHMKLFGLDASNVQGTVWVEDCEILGGVPAVRAQSVARLLLQGVTVTGPTTYVDPYQYFSFPGGRGVELQDTHAVVRNSTITGGSSDDFSPTVLGYTIGTAGFEALVIVGGTLSISGSTLTGGSGGDGGITTVSQCFPGNDGGAALSLGAGQPVVKIQDCALVGGPGGAAPVGTCGFGDHSAGDVGAPLVQATGSVTTYSGEATSLHVAAPAREGQDVQLGIDGPPGAAVTVALALAPGLQSVANVAGPIVVALPPLLLPVGTIPPSGELSVHALLPELGPGVLSVNLFLQAVTVVVHQLPQASSASVLVGLDGSL